MNTKKKIRRWAPKVPVNILEGIRRSGIDNDEIALLLGQVLAEWPHLEEQMISVFHRLLGVAGDSRETAHLIFTALVNQKIRIDVMRALLEKGAANKDKELEYDELVDEFSKLNAIRNKYVHGLWWTHDCGDVYLQTDNSVYSQALVEFEKITEADIQDFHQRLTLMSIKILEL